MPTRSYQLYSLYPRQKNLPDRNTFSCTFPIIQETPVEERQENTPVNSLQKYSYLEEGDILCACEYVLFLDKKT